MKRQPVKEEPFDFLMKTIIIGDSGVGKSNLLLRFGSGKFAENYVMTIGINFIYKVVAIGGVKLKLQIWDTAGQDKYKTITQSYYNGSNGVIVVYGVDSRSSFNSVRNIPANVGSWITDLREKVQADCQIVLIANKTDVLEQEVSSEEGRNLAEEFEVPFFECSAKTGQNVQEAFECLAQLMKTYIVDGQMESQKRSKIKAVNLKKKPVEDKQQPNRCSC